MLIYSAVLRVLYCMCVIDQGANIKCRLGHYLLYDIEHTCVMDERLSSLDKALGCVCISVGNKPRWSMVVIFITSFVFFVCIG